MLNQCSLASVQDVHGPGNPCSIFFKVSSGLNISNGNFFTCSLEAHFMRADNMDKIIKDFNEILKLFIAFYKI